MGTIRYVVRSDKPLKDGLLPIDLVYQIKSQKQFFRTKEKLMILENWDNDKKEVIYFDKKKLKKLYPRLHPDFLPSQKEVDSINYRLATLKKNIREIEIDFGKIPYTISMVLDKLKGDPAPQTTPQPQPSNQVFDFINKYIEENRASRVAGSLTVYKSLNRHLQNYQDKVNAKVTFDNIDYSFFQSFNNFLIGSTKVVGGATVPLMNNITINKQLSTLKTLLSYAKKQNIKVESNYNDFTITKEELEVIALNENEFEALYNFDLSNNKRLDRVRDVFCFSCLTGLRYSDLLQLRWEHIKEKVIKIKSKKTKINLEIPMRKRTREILDKYTGQINPLPVITNQKMNLYLKDLCEQVGINDTEVITRRYGGNEVSVTYKKYELISAHSGRKTFACLSLKKGLPTQVVMNIGGWKDYKSFQRYINVDTDWKIDATLKAWGEDV